MSVRGVEKLKPRRPAQYRVVTYIPRVVGQDLADLAEADGGRSAASIVRTLINNYLRERREGGSHV